MSSLNIKNIYRFLNPSYQTLFLEYKVNLKPRYGKSKPVHEDLHQIINANRELYKTLLNKCVLLKEKFREIKDASIETDPVAPSWNNGYLPGLDMITLYSMLNEYHPGKYIEIGSGNSTKIAHWAKKEQHLQTEIISVDPKPRAEIDRIANQIIREPFEDTNLDITGLLNENDILFVDNSHRILPNSDSMVFFMEVLPKLKKGVIVHIHDVYLPYDYPQFMCDRFYSEQYGLAFFLLANPERYSPLLPNYFISQDSELSKIIAPVWKNQNMSNVEKHGGSFWMIIQ